MLMGFVCGVLVALIVELVRANPVWIDAPSNSTLLIVFLAVFGRGVPQASASGIEIEKASWEPARQLSEGISVGAVMGSVSIAFAALCLVDWGIGFIAARAHQRAVARRELVNQAPTPGR